MKLNLTITLWFLTILSLNPISSFAQSPKDRKVVVLHGTVLITARGDGSEIKEILHNDTPKAEPQWSPDGTKILYRIAGQELKDPKTFANLVVITPDNSFQKTIPVMKTEGDGTVVGGMRFVEDSGWYDNSAVFASGTVNPYIVEFRIIDVESSRVIESYFGTNFVTCSHKGKVAYVPIKDGVPGDNMSRIGVNGSLLYSRSNNTDTMIRNLHWSQDCQRLAFIEGSETDADFVVLHSATLESRHRLQPEFSQPLEIANISESFLLRGGKDFLFYNIIEKSLQLAPEVIEKWQKEERARDDFIKNLGGGFADWWQPIR